MRASCGFNIGYAPDLGAHSCGFNIGYAPDLGAHSCGFNIGYAPDLGTYSCGFNAGGPANPAAFHRQMLSQSAAILEGLEPDLIETPRVQTLAERTKRRRVHQQRHNRARRRGRPSPLEVIRSIAANEAREGIRRGAAAATARQLGETRHSISKLQKTAEGWRDVFELAREYCLLVIESGCEGVPGELRVLPAILAECERVLDEFQPLSISTGRSSLSADARGEKRHLKIQTPYKLPRHR
jgi:hypothetical protein